MLVAEYLTTDAIDCTGLIDTELRFRRWLGVESGWFDKAIVEVSANGTDWALVWEHTDGDSAVNESSWSLQSYDISAVADGESTVYVRWGMGPTDGVTTYPGWNIDDVEIWAAMPSIPADFTGDGLVTLDDYELLDACLAGPAGGE